MSIAIQIAIFVERTASQFLQFALVDVSHRRKRGSCNEYLVEEKSVLIVLTDDFSNEGDPFQAKAIDPEINLNILAVVEQGTDRFEIVVPGVEGHFRGVLLKDDRLNLWRVGVGKFRFLVLVQIGQTPSLRVFACTKGLLHVMEEVRIHFAYIISGNLACGKPFNNFRLLRFCCE